MEYLCLGIIVIIINNNKISSQIFLILPFLYCWTLSLENKLNIPHLSAKPNKVLHIWVYHNRNLSFHAWDTRVCNNFGISEDSSYIAYFTYLLWFGWGQNIHAILKEFWKQKPLYFWSVLQSHETCLKLLSVHAFTKRNTLARPVKQDGRVRSALLTSFCLIMFDLCVLMQ